MGRILHPACHDLNLSKFWMPSDEKIGSRNQKSPETLLERLLIKERNLWV
jgi:hypothetical protein